MEKKLPKSAVDGLEDSLQDFVDSIGDLQSQIDGEIDSWFYDYEPTTKNKPASEWTTEALQIKHEGDLFYNVKTGIAYRYVYDNDSKSHMWVAITDAELTKALDLISKAQSTADNKCQTFYKQPTNYDDGDFWILESDTTVNNVNYSKGTMLVAVLPTGTESRTEFVASDWIPVTTKSAEKALNDLSDIASDGKITPVEKQQLKLTVGDIKSDKKSIDLQCNSYSIKSEGEESDTTYKKYISAYNSLITMTDGLLKNMSVTSDTPSNFNTLFDEYYTALSNMASVIETASKNFTSASVSSLKTDLQGQLDSKIETFYQSTVPTWDEKDNKKHTGDLWFNTSETNITSRDIVYKAKTNYRFDGTKWEQSGIVPQDVYDTIDGIASIVSYTSLFQQNQILVICLFQMKMLLILLIKTRFFTMQIKYINTLILNGRKLNIQMIQKLMRLVLI